MMTGRTDDPANRSKPALWHGFQSRIIVRNGSRSIRASGHGAASTGRTNDRNRPARQIFQSCSCIRGAVHTGHGGAGASLAANNHRPLSSRTDANAWRRALMAATSITRSGRIDAPADKSSQFLDSFVSFFPPPRFFSSDPVALAQALITVTGMITPASTTAQRARMPPRRSSPNAVTDNRNPPSLNSTTLSTNPWTRSRSRAASRQGRSAST